MFSFFNFFQALSFFSFFLPASCVLPPSKLEGDKAKILDMHNEKRRQVKPRLFTPLFTHARMFAGKRTGTPTRSHTRTYTTARTHVYTRARVLVAPGSCSFVHKSL